MTITESKLISRLKVPKTRQLRFNVLVNNYLPKAVRFSKEDSCLACVPALVIKTKGKGIRETFFDFEIVTLDTGKIGRCWGEMVLRLTKDETIEHYFPRKFKVDSDRVLKLIINK